MQSDVSEKDKDHYSILTHIYGTQKDGNDNPICKTEKDTDVQNRLLDSVGEGEGGMFQENSIETCILSRVKQITSPGWMDETSAWTWCTGKTQRDRVEREVGTGIGMGNTCKPMADPFQCMTKSTTIKKNNIISHTNNERRRIRAPGQPMNNATSWKYFTSSSTVRV